MSLSRPDSAIDEKSTPPQKKLASSNNGFFSRWGKNKPEEKQEEASEPKAPEPEKADAASFTQLFRFSTKTEITMNVTGIIAAALAGSAQPLMSLLFGNLTQAFVNFGTALLQASGPNDPAVLAAGQHFRHVAGVDAGFICVIGAGLFFCTYLYMYIWVYTGEVNAKRIRELYLKAVLRQEIAFFDNVGAGEVATRIQTDTHLVQQGISEKVALSVQFVSSFVTGFVVAYARSWRLALALSSILPCISITGTLMNKTITKYLQLSLRHTAEGGTVAEEVISTIRTAQAFGTQQILGDLYDTYVEKSHLLELKGAVGQGCGLASFFFIIYSAYGLAFSFGTTLIIRGEATAGIVVNVFMAILIGSLSLALLAPRMQAIFQGRAAAAKLFATIDRVPVIDSEDTGGLKPDTVRGEIKLESVSFNYPSRPDVSIVKDLSITFPAGKTSALVGASGSGKSTIVSLVERFYDPLAGAVTFDGIDLRALNLKWLRSQIGLVSQEPTLFATTIAGNVAHGLIGSKWQYAPEEERAALIREACVKANADGFISKLPMGYDTLVGERGFLLSGGQKQRIAIARAIVSDPRILLLDEATSALDTQSEGVVQDALDKAAAGRTTITIAHRLSTIKGAACIFVMGQGVVLEKGSHDELLRDPNGAYTRLVAAQKLREAQEDPSGADTVAGSDSDIDEKDLEREIREEVPLRRQNTSHSIASDILEQHRKAGGGVGKFEEKEYSLTYLFRRMGTIQKTVWKKYLIGVFFACLAGMVYPAFGIVYAQAITTFSIKGNNALLRHDGDRNALWFFIIAILSMCCIGIHNFVFASTAANLTARLRSLTFKAILRQDIGFFDHEQHSTGALTSNLSDAPQKVNGLAGITLGAIVQSMATIIAGAIIGLAFAWKLALVGIACMPLLVSAGYIRLRVVVLKDQQNKKAHEASAQLACEAAGSVRTVASLTREEDCCEIYSKSLEEPMRRSAKTAIWSNLIFSLSQSMMFFVIALVFWYGSVLVSRDEFSTTDFFVALFSVTFGAIQAGNVFSFVPDISSAKGAATDIINLLDSRPEIDAESTEGEIPQDVQGRIRIENVHFRYPTRPGVRVLRDLSIKIEPGTYVALVGASGCGKSTVIQMIERFYDPLAGQIYLDGQDISTLNIQEYRKHIALVSQEPTLYAGTIRFNILLGATKPHSEVTQAEIETACENANILDFINSLPQGFDTDVGGKGSQLSGGQKQRIAIARALLRNPKVLLLDEATSALDSNSEEIVQEALDQAAKGRTTIAIAHRLSTIQNADCIYFIKDGKVSESGTHDQLLALRGGYSEFVQLQALSKK